MSPPYEGEHLWKWFLDLDSARGSNGFGGLNPISYTEIANWSRLTGVSPSPWETSVLRRMDLAALAAHADKRPIETATGKKVREIMVDDVDAIEKMLNRLG